MTKYVFVYKVAVLGISEERPPKVTFLPQANSSNLKLETYILLPFLFLANNIKEIVPEQQFQSTTVKRDITITQDRAGAEANNLFIPIVLVKNKGRVLCARFGSA